MKKDPKRTEHEDRRKNYRPEQPLNNGQLVFEVSKYDGKDTDTVVLTRSEVLALNLQSYGSCRAKCLNVFGFREAASGKWVHYGENGHSVGPICLKMLEAIQWNPSVFLAPSTLYELTGKENLLDPANFASRTHALRLAHGETKKTEHFILTNNGGIAWPKNLTWISVVPFRAADDAVVDGPER